MPGAKQNTVNSPATEKSLGPGLSKSSTSDLQAAFATSPIHNGVLDDDSVREQFQKDVLDGIINDGGHTFGTFDPQYTGDLTKEGGNAGFSETKTGGGGLPASAWVPNPASPGEGSTNPADIPEAPDGYGKTPSDTPFSGVGSQLDPKTTSVKIAGQTLGDYVLGASSKE